MKAALKKWRIANLRYFNPVGAHQKGLLGENPKENLSNLFPAINRVLKKNRKNFLFLEIIGLLMMVLVLGTLFTLWILQRLTHLH